YHRPVGPTSNPDHGIGNLHDFRSMWGDRRQSYSPKQQQGARPALERIPRPTDIGLEILVSALFPLLDIGVTPPATFTKSILWRNSMNNVTRNETALVFGAIAQEAGKAIMAASVSTEIKKKQDGSPVTRADLDANLVICSRLAELLPEVPVVSEET